jgi:hypothetical protein
MDRFGAGLSNDVAEARLAGIDGLLAVIVVGIRNSPMNIASEELEEVAVRPAKRRLKRQVKSIKAQGDGYDKAAHHLWFHVLEGHLDPDRGRVEAHAASLGPYACIV